jgi:LemA protein
VPLEGWLAIVVVAAILAGLGYLYNGLVRRRNRVDSTWSDIDVLLRRRHDLVPNLVSSVQGYAGHESATMRSVTDARAAAMNAVGPTRLGTAETDLAGGVRTLIAEAEAYPQLKASTAFIDLQERLTATEDGIEHARQFYNDAVYGYNTAIQTLPGNLVARPLGFRPREYFQSAGGERAPVQVRV